MMVTIFDQPCPKTPAIRKLHSSTPSFREPELLPIEVLQCGESKLFKFLQFLTDLVLVTNIFPIIYFLCLQCHFSKGSSVLFILRLILLVFGLQPFLTQLGFDFTTFTHNRHNPYFVSGSCSREPGEGKAMFKTRLHNNDKFIIYSIGVIIKECDIKIRNL